MPLGIRQESTARSGAVAMALVVFTLGTLLVHDTFLRQELTVSAAQAAFERHSAHLDHALRQGAKKAEVAARWHELQTAATDLAPKKARAAVIDAVAVADAAISRRAAASTAPLAASVQVLADLRDTVRDVLATERTTTSRRRRALTGLVAMLLLVETGVLVVACVLQGRRREPDADRATAALTHLAHHDALTGLANRRAMEDRLQVLAAEPGARFGVILCDLDGFKPINDVFGHDAGDAVLKAVAHRLEHGLRPGDLPARHGGDEFVLVVADAPDATTLNAIAERLRERLAHPVRHGAHELRFGASLGTAIFPADGATPHALLSAADAAMYEAKQAGGMTIRPYTTRLRERDSLRQQIAYELEAALAEDRLELALQPQVETASGRLAGFEALARWHSDARGYVSPDVFIPVAESTGLLAPLTSRILAQTAQLLETFSAIEPVRISVNVTALSLGRDDILDDLVTLARGNGPARLGIEIAEDAMFGRNADLVLAELSTLRNAGVAIAIDDFGTGYASLSHLAEIPFDHLKIAGDFVGQIESNPNAAALVRTIIELAQRLGGAAIANRVETERQLTFLHRHGCDIAQGFLLGPPLDVAQATTMVCNRMEHAT